MNRNHSSVENRGVGSSGEQDDTMQLLDWRAVKFLSKYFIFCGSFLSGFSDWA